MQEYRKISAENLYKMIRKYQSATFSMAIASKNNACVTITLQTKLIHLTYNSKRDIPVISSDVNSDSFKSIFMIPQFGNPRRANALISL